MKIFVAGATGAIGRPLIAALIRDGHTVFGMSRDEKSARRLKQQGAEAVRADALDVVSVEQALRVSGAEVLIDELTSLPKDPADMPKAAAGDRKLRLEGGGNLHRAAMAARVKRYIQQSSGFFLSAPGGTEGGALADESCPLLANASPGITASAATYAELEARIARSGAMEGVTLRYGFFYGPGTWYCPEGAAAEHVRKGETPIIGKGSGVWSFVHIDDAAEATAAAVKAPAGTYNIVDDNPSPVSVWLPAFARALGAPPPPVISETDAHEQSGPDAVFYGTRIGGASNAKAKRVLGFNPRKLEWL